MANIRYLPITEEMYNHVFYWWRELKSEDFIWENNFHFITSEKEWNELLNNTINLHPKDHFIYFKSDITYILSRPYLFSGLKKPNYGKTYSCCWYVYQYRANDNIQIDTRCEEALNGWTAWMIFRKELKKHYTEDEIREIIAKYGYEEEEKPKHSNIYQIKPGCKRYESNVIYTFNNVRYYDLNKAYASNLMKMFPRLEKWMLNGYKKNKAYFKPLINYVVGYMQRMKGENGGLNFRLIRNAIVHNINERMNIAFYLTEDDNSEKLYVNTDGFIINNPRMELFTSNEIGDFKREIVDNDTVKFIKVKVNDYQNYTIMQWYENGEKVIKTIGGFLQQEVLLDKVDLFANKTVLFNTERIGQGIDDKGNPVSREIVILDSIKEIKLNG